MGTGRSTVPTVSGVGFRTGEVMSYGIVICSAGPFSDEW